MVRQCCHQSRYSHAPRHLDFTRPHPLLHVLSPPRHLRHHSCQRRVALAPRCPKVHPLEATTRGREHPEEKQGFFD